MKPISDAEFSRFQRFIFEAAGISMADAKKALVSGRLSRRLAHHGLDSFGAYFQLLASGKHPDEVQMAVDLLTTNETYFFREMKHFEFLRSQALAARSRPQPFRLWSAASSSGEEAYSMAMVLADCMQTTPWEIVGTDISTRVIEGARRALYSMERGRHIPPDYLRRFCRKGTGQFDGHLLIDRSLRSKVSFRPLNLNNTLPEQGQFDIVFLRNVMIYFNNETKRQVVARVISTIKPGGYFCVGHSESLNDITTAVQMVAPAIYRKGA
ncbi:protein-glutamate O-methyltransferase CheR [Rhodoferax sp.]|uniref:CheR family methyltransferase n=1 Tax=Rhodoferax sp. TaxID=50421 RepID=UPI0008ADC39B|nr:protein-glutamate O-methyltransferase CheR [Rhodoferax sp.]MDO8319947.1 protein-glutamate O-methyltransferase CheR [Rhodoferax sp.]MDP2680027.1 protein-glutamate O-methyltransferase CheR [Rhodoferax sp.]OGB51631.1 MAG: SAM-dependent methyltransferase [Burkholderiales bacterium RIFOXYD12_FULL_59_19]OGB73978.1 MAG: SAM-dependent methyltransferase [Burkholderiales bacterium RIFOXYC12_FULL_60_6]